MDWSLKGTRIKTFREHSGSDGSQNFHKTNLTEFIISFQFGSLTFAKQLITRRKNRKVTLVLFCGNIFSVFNPSGGFHTYVFVLWSELRVHIY